MSTNTSSFSSSTVFIEGNDGGSRLLVNLPSGSCTGGVGEGDVIHYDAITLFYKKSIADNPPNSEVFGIVEALNVDGSVDVVIYGSIALPSEGIEDIPIGSTGSGGGSDIYFLSPDTAGKIRNTTPNELTQIIKPIYQVAPHGVYSGIVMNYIGYKVPSDITITTPQNRSTPIGSIEYYLPLPFYDGITTISNNYRKINLNTPGNPNLIDNSNGEFSEFATKYGDYFGKFFVASFTPVAVDNFAGLPYPTWDPVAVYTSLGFRYRPCVMCIVPSSTVVLYNSCIVDFLESKIFIPESYAYNISVPTNLTIGAGVTYNIRYNDQPGQGGAPGGGGNFVLTSISADQARRPLPAVYSTFSSCFSFQDQDNAVIGSDIIDDAIISLLKIKTQSTSNIVSSFQANTLNTENFILDNDDLLTKINDLESRILLAEQEINK
jgi:hypothetical protein